MSPVRCTAILFAALVYANSYQLFAHQDMIGVLSKVEKVYSAPDPIGQLRVAYSTSNEGEVADLTIDSQLFSATVPREGLEDLPRPDWSALYATYSFTVDESGRSTGIPYLTVRVPLHGPIGQAWSQTWVTFYWNADGELSRHLRMHKMSDVTNMTHVYWGDWAIGEGIDAETALRTAQGL